METSVQKNRKAKLAYFDRVYEAASLIECSCGCGTLIKSVDKYARPVRYVNGHNNRKYEDPSQHKREWNHRNRKSRMASKKKMLCMKRQRLVDEFGGSCKHCGLQHDKKNTIVFDFHHLDPLTKVFNISSSVNRYGFEVILEEAAKCILLCSNCHRLLHAGMISL